MSRKAVIGVILLLLGIGIFGLVFNVRSGIAVYDFDITIEPESPSTLDEINATISFTLANTNENETFGAVEQIGNEFFVDINISVPFIVLPALRPVAYTYNLGRLPEGAYLFIVTVTRLSITYRYNETFTVSAPSILGDLNNDGSVDISDVVMAGKAFASYPGHPRWDSRADMNTDDVVDIFDLLLIVKNFGKTL